MSNGVRAESCRIGRWIVGALCVGVLVGTMHCGAYEPRESEPAVAAQAQGLLTAISEQSWNAKTTDSPGRYGSLMSLAADGNRALIGQPGRDASSGKIELYERSAGSWSFKAGLDARSYHSASYGQRVSAALSRDGSTLILGDAGSGGSGRIRIYEQTSAGWQQRVNTEISGRRIDDIMYFGFSVALSATGEIAAVSKPNLLSLTPGESVILYRRVVEGGTVTWKQAGSIAAPMFAARFGIMLALSADGRSVLVRSVWNTGSPAGARVDAYTLDKDLRVESMQVLKPEGSAEGERFGQGLALSSDGLTAVVGAPDEGWRGAAFPTPGAAYIFTKDSAVGSFRQHIRLVASDDEGAQFGAAVATTSDGQRVLIGAPYASMGTTAESGAAYLFARQGGSWVRQNKIRASSLKSQDHFGTAVALDSAGRSALVGAPDRDILVTVGDMDYSISDVGELFSYAIRSSNGDACTGNAECASGFCIDGVCCNNECGGGIDSDCQACSKTRGAASDGTCGAVKRDQVCRPSQGVCDPAEVCDGTALACPSQVILKGTVCRASVGLCDAAEKCNGVDASCPSDKKEPSGKECRGAAGACDRAEVCDGVRDSCPPDLPSAAGTVCRAKDGPCDLEEVCNGSSPKCPDDDVVPKGTVCKEGRKGEDERCDPNDICDGSTKQCTPIQLNPGDSCSDDPMKPKKCDPELRCIGK